MPTTVPPRHRIVEANHRIANQLGQLAGLLKTQIDATARGPQSLSRQSVVDTLRVHFEFADRGRGPSYDASYVIDPHG